MKILFALLILSSSIAQGWTKSYINPSYNGGYTVDTSYRNPDTGYVSSSRSYIEPSYNGGWVLSDN